MARQIAVVSSHHTGRPAAEQSEAKLHAEVVSLRGELSGLKRQVKQLAQLVAGQAAGGPPVPGQRPAEGRGGYAGRGTVEEVIDVDSGDEGPVYADAGQVPAAPEDAARLSAESQHEGHSGPEPNLDAAAATSASETAMDNPGRSNPTAQKEQIVEPESEGLCHEGHGSHDGMHEGLSDVVRTNWSEETEVGQPAEDADSGAFAEGGQPPAVASRSGGPDTTSVGGVSL